MSVSIGASAAGVRAYTATSSQGLLYMAEAVFNASGLGLPIVMTVANRAVGAPINIWNDHSDAMALRDAGWIQLFAETNQEAVDLHIQAFRLAEELSAAGDGLHGRLHPHPRRGTGRDPRPRSRSTGSCRRSRPQQVLDPAAPVSIGAMVGPEAFTEVRYLAQARQLEALDRIPELAVEFERVARAPERRPRLGLPQRGRRDDRRRAGLDRRNDQGRRRPDARGGHEDRCRQPDDVPAVSRRQALAEALEGAHRVVVIEKAFAIGGRGILGADVDALVSNRGTRTYTVVAGLGGRAITEGVAAPGLRRGDPRRARRGELPRSRPGGRRPGARPDGATTPARHRASNGCCATCAQSAARIV